MKNSESPSRILFLASGAGAGLAFGLLIALLQLRKRSLWQVAGFALAGCILANAASFLIPSRYTASAVMWIAPATLTEDPLKLPPQLRLPHSSDR